MRGVLEMLSVDGVLLAVVALSLLIWLVQEIAGRPCRIARLAALSRQALVEVWRQDFLSG